jgi:hypothetical protein
MKKVEMKKVLIATTALAGLALAVAPAQAGGFDGFAGGLAGGIAGGVIAGAIAAQAAQAAAAHPHYIFVRVPVRERRHVVHASPRPHAPPHQVAHVAPRPATPRPASQPGTEHFGS